MMYPQIISLVLQIQKNADKALWIKKSIVLLTYKKGLPKESPYTQLPCLVAAASAVAAAAAVAATV